MVTTYTALKEALVVGLGSAERRARDRVFETFEGYLAAVELLPPWMVYSALALDSPVDVDYRASALRRLHKHQMVPEGFPASFVGDSIIHIMISEASERVKTPAFMATGILRSPKPPVVMLPIPKDMVDRYLIPYVTTPHEKPSDSLNHALHTMPTLTALSAIHGGAYNSILAEQLRTLPDLRERAVYELQRSASQRLDVYGYTHVMEHLAHSLEIAAAIEDKQLMSVFTDGNALPMLQSIDEQREQRGISDERVQAFLLQRDKFLETAGRL